MIPKIEFRYSWIYDYILRNSPKVKKRLKKEGESYPSKKKILKYMKDVEKIWKKEGPKILKEISKITGFKWKEKKVICYVRGYGRPFSDPLTMKLYKNKDDFIDVLTHEMIHQIQRQNIEKWIKWKKYAWKKYQKEPFITKNHILLHSIHAVLLRKLFGEKRLEKEVKRPINKDYKRSWEIVQKEGYENIINEFKKRIK